MGINVTPEEQAKFKELNRLRMKTYRDQTRQRTYSPRFSKNNKRVYELIAHDLMTTGQRLEEVLKKYPNVDAKDFERWFAFYVPKTTKEENL